MYTAIKHYDENFEILACELVVDMKDTDLNESPVARARLAEC